MAARSFCTRPSPPRFTATVGQVADSWQRSHDAGVDPSGRRLAPVLSDADETAARWDVHPLARLTALFREYLASVADEAGNLLVVSDAQGVLLWIQGDLRLRHDAADRMNFAEGTLWSEGGTGTKCRRERRSPPTTRCRSSRQSTSMRFLVNRLAQDAVLIGLARRLEEQGSWCGETRIQKAAYLLHGLLGVELSFDFILYSTGCSASSSGMSCSRCRRTS